MSSLAVASASLKNASPDYPIEELIAKRWSPYGFAERPVSDSDLRSLFEAARWAASSYNEQPWIYFVATKSQPAEFDRLLSCLVPANQVWAKAAPVLVLGVVNLRFSRTKADNRAAVHDLGLASANLVMEATARGLSVHQMIGVLPDQARALYQIPEHSEVWTALAIGYRANAAEIPADMRERDLAPRLRKPISRFVFGGVWGRPASITLGENIPAAE